MSKQEDLRARLAAPFDDVKWRLQQVTPKQGKPPYQEGSRGMFLAYIDARQLYDRLDDVLGFGNWQRTVKQVNADGSVIVSLSLRIGDEWVTHEDVGYSNNPGSDYEQEPLKAAVSDGAKRAAVGFGIGRFLYELEARWMPIDQWGKPLGDVNPNTGELPPRARTTSQNTVPDDPYGSSLDESQPVDFANMRGRRMAASAERGHTANGNGQYATPAQQGFLIKLANETGLGEDGLAGLVQHDFGVPLGQLDKRDASSLIERLQAQARAVR